MMVRSRDDIQVVTVSTVAMSAPGCSHCKLPLLAAWKYTHRTDDGWHFYFCAECDSS